MEEGGREGDPRKDGARWVGWGAEKEEGFLGEVDVEVGGVGATVVPLVLPTGVEEEDPSQTLVSPSLFSSTTMVLTGSTGVPTFLSS